jgi:hypothetical protein
VFEYKMLSIVLTFDTHHHLSHDRLFIQCIVSLLPLIRYGASLIVYTTTVEETKKLIQQASRFIMSRTTITDVTEELMRIYGKSRQEIRVASPPFVGHYRVFAIPLLLRETGSPVLYLDHDTKIQDLTKLLPMILLPTTDQARYIPRLWAPETVTLGTIQSTSSKVTKMALTKRMLNFYTMNNGTILAHHESLPLFERAKHLYQQWYTSDHNRFRWSNDAYCINYVLCSIGYSDHTHNLASCIDHYIQSKKVRFVL